MTESNADVTRLRLVAPVSGVIVPNDEIPDPDLAAAMAGHGLVIEPGASPLVAPFDGEVVSLRPSSNVVTIRSAEGLEVMLHIGLDTLVLHGHGFTPEVSAGQSVHAGDPLISFDLAQISRTSDPLTLIVITNTEITSAIEPAAGLVRAGVDVACVVTLARVDPDAITLEPSGEGASSRLITIPNPTGLHARPAAILANLAKGYHSDIELRRGSDVANAKSIMSIMGLAADHMHRVQVVAHGHDAAIAVRHLAQAIREGLGEDLTPLEETAPPRALVATSEDPHTITGVSVAPGVAIGHVVRLLQEPIPFAERGAGAHREQRALTLAIDHALLQLLGLRTQLDIDSGTGAGGIFAAQQEIVKDPELLETAQRLIEAGRSAAASWHAAFTRYADRIAELPNPVMAARADDIRDVGDRVLERLTGHARPLPSLPVGAVVVTEKISPSLAVLLARAKVAGFATVLGGPEGHVATIARDLHIPAVAGLGAGLLSLEDDIRVVLDGTAGVLRLDQTDDQVAALAAEQQHLADLKAQRLARAGEPALTKDGRRVYVLATVTGLADAESAERNGAEGIGLLRSEVMFARRATPPGQREQAGLYGDIASTLKRGQRYVIRTLPGGSELAAMQMRAIIGSVTRGTTLGVVVPGVITRDEWRAVKAMVEGEAASRGARRIQVGLELSSPACLSCLPDFASEVDFFSLDADQLAAAGVGGGDAEDPAVFRFIRDVAEIAHAAGRTLGVSGRMAAAPESVPLLVGLGVDALSCAVDAIPAVKAEVRSLSAAECRELAQQAMAAGSASDVHSLVHVGEF